MPSSHARATIAIDIDEVLFPFIVGVAEHHNKMKGTALTPEDFISFKLHEIWGCTLEGASQVVDSFLASDSLALEPIEGAQKALSALKQDFTVVLVTARNGISEPETRRWLQHHFSGLFDEVIFAGNAHDGRPHRSKGEICKELGAVLLIDDHPNNILSATQSGIDGILFGEKVWTVMDTLPASAVRHCKDWTQTERYIYDEWRSPRLS